MMAMSSACRGCIAEVALQQRRCDPLIMDMFAYCTNIQITHDQGLPRHFCERCHDSITFCFRFLRRARRVDATLRSLLTRTTQTSVIVQPNLHSLSQYAEESMEFNDDSSIIQNYCSQQDTSCKEIIYLNSTNGFIKELPNSMEQVDKSNSGQKFTIREEKEAINFILYNGSDPSEKSITKNIARMKPVQTCNLSTGDIFSSGNQLCDSNETLSTINRNGVAETRFENVANVAESTDKKTEYIERIAKRSEISKTEDKYEVKATAQCGESNGNKCPFCQRVFITKTWLEKHIPTHSKGRFTCKYCSKDFSHQYLLRQHEVVHSNSRPFACSRCPKLYKLRKQLNFHARSHRQQPQLFQCHYCSIRLKSKSVLINHITQIHEKGKTSLCHLCGAAFSQPGNLEVHMRVHTGAKPHRCRRCAFRCSSASSLRRHERRHDGARPHACDTCGKTFHDASGLSRHARTHTGALPYRCELCGRAFIDSWKRKNHIMKQHHVPFQDVSRARKLTSAHS